MTSRYIEKLILDLTTDKSCKGTVVNRALSSLHGGSLEIVLTVPFYVQKFEVECELSINGLGTLVLNGEEPDQFISFCLAENFL